MDTRFWGPCGWNLLHNITHSFSNYMNSEYIEKYKTFFYSLPNILPCIYCRNSLNQYYKELPLMDKHFKSNRSLSYWLYLIHNKVNNKLRNQNLLNKCDPSFCDIINKYKNSKICSINKCWNFLYSIGMNYPLYSKDIDIKLKYNYYIFFKYLIELFPNNITKKKLINYNNIFNIYNFLDNRITLLKWLYGIEKILNKNCKIYKHRIELTSKFIAGCKGNKTDVKPTCRSKFIK